MKTTSPHATMNRIEVKAAEWLSRRRDDKHSPEEDAQFYAWIEADPRHGEAYDALALTLEDVGQLPELSKLVSPRRPRWTARTVVGAGIALACIGLVFFTQAQNNPTQTIATEIAQTRTVTLEDGSVVYLGAGSTIRTRFDSNARHVVLEGGEAYFEVAHDASHPFYVEAGGTVVRVLGTRFHVHRGASGVRVAVSEGRVQVRDTRAITLTSPAVRELTAGQATEIQDRPTYIAFAAVAPPVEAAPASVGVWQSGRFAYDNATLADVVADINRYYRPSVRLADPAAAEQRVTAAFRVDEIPAFIDALDATLPVTVERDSHGAYLIADTPSPAN
jgi:transmembrane sensor